MTRLALGFGHRSCGSTAIKSAAKEGPELLGLPCLVAEVDGDAVAIGVGQHLLLARIV